MKKVSFFIFGAAAAFASVACSVETMNPSTSADTRVPMEFSAGISDDGTADSKTSINSNLNVLWSEGDAISVFDGTYNNKFDLTSGADSKSGSFSGSANKVPEYVALYPYSASASYANNTITASLPSQQYSTVDGSFETMLYPSVAKTSGNSMILRNIAGLIRVTVNNLPDGTGVSSIQLSASESLTGAYTVDTSGEDFEAVRSGSESSGAVLTAKDGGNLAAGPYHIVVLPGEYTDFKVTVVLSDNSYVTMSGPASITANGGLDIAIDASAATANSQGLYGLFMAGEDIYIGGTAYNKSQFEENQIRYPTEDFNISTSNNGQIIFVNNDVNITSFGSPSNLILIGNDPDNKPVIPINGSKYLVATDTTSKMILKNLVLDPSSSTTKYMFTPNQDNKTFEEFTLDNCDIEILATGPFLTISNNRHLDKFIMTNCNVTIPSGTSNRYIINCTSNTTIEEIVFRNNVFHSSDDNIVGNFSLLTGSTTITDNNTTVSRLTVNNNTFLNTVPTRTAMLIANSFGEVSLLNNLVYCSLQYTGNRNIFRSVAYPHFATTQNNAFYDTNDLNYNIFYIESGTLNGYSEPFRQLEDTPFESVNVSSGKYTIKAEYASYGAQR